jgi:tetratricopeptide (TPR) repeat protein
MLRGDFRAIDLGVFRDKVARSPAGSAWRCGYTWCLAELGHTAEAEAHLTEIAADGYAKLPFDVNWLSAAGECAEACTILGATGPAEALYELLAPYAGRPITAGRALANYGSADRHLGGLAAVLGRRDAAIAHYERAIALDASAGLRPWVARARAGLARLAGAPPRRGTRA